jgi:sugar/nucleoside kinase (ribokinase family)
MVNLPSLKSTTFSNIETPQGRVQKLYHRAESLEYYLVPQAWRNPAILHLAPVAQEVSADFVRHFPQSFIGITPQGWLRAWDEEGRVYPAEWPEATFVLPYTNATVLSIEDVGGNESLIEEISASCHIVAVTEGAEGSRVYWNGDVRRFRPPPKLSEVDAVGAGDIYAAAFFIRLFDTRDAWEAGRFATQLASYSITRRGLDSPPTPEEIEGCMIEVT